MKKYNSTTPSVSTLSACGRDFAVIGLLLMTMTTVRADYQSSVLTDNPLAYYALDASVVNNGIATDLTTNGNNGTPQNVGTAAGPTAYITQSTSFDPGSLSQIDLSGANATNAGILNFTNSTALEAWVLPADLSFGDIIAKGYDQSDNYHEIALRANGSGNGGNYFGYFGGPSVSGGSQNTNNWVYLVVSNDGTNTSFFVNGVLVQSTPDTQGSVTFVNNVPWAIGDGTVTGNSRFFNGNICQVAIYNHGLTAAQVLRHFYFAELNADPSNSAPIILTQPQPTATYIGGTATFSVSAVSAFAMTNQWFKNGTPISGQTSATLTLSNVQNSDVTGYSVVVGGVKGATNSVVAALSLFTPNHLKWSGAASAVWDTATTANWINQSSSAQTVFNYGDYVLFDDTTGVPTSVTGSGTLTPSGITVNSSVNNFTIGSGTVAGSGGLVKLGSSKLTIYDSGSMTGPVTIGAGSITAGNNAFNSVASIVISNNATLNLNGSTITGSRPVTVSGTGNNGQGAIISDYNDYAGQSLILTLTGDTLFGFPARWDLRSGSQINGPHYVTLDSSVDFQGSGSGGDGNPYSEWQAVNIGADVLGITLTNGIGLALTNTAISKLGLHAMDTAFQNPGTVMTVAPNCIVYFWDGGYNGSFHVLNGGQVYLWTAPAAFNGSTVTLENNALWDSTGGSGTEPINSAMTLNGVAHIVLGGHNMLYTNLVNGAGGFVWDTGDHQMILQAANTYSGPTVIGGGGPMLALTGN
ncbi:MAG TPA: LamG-like jellyroll fold domain-containing protein, partial [Candidatus Acidoferrum sp.]|nr:LamG-like jellyroll fold domain-containing protein [Candidatus Acidoferrum sp.]